MSEEDASFFCLIFCFVLVHILIHRSTEYSFKKALRKQNTEDSNRISTNLVLRRRKWRTHKQSKMIWLMDCSLKRCNQYILYANLAFCWWYFWFNLVKPVFSSITYEFNHIGFPIFVFVYAVDFFFSIRLDLWLQRFKMWVWLIVIHSPIEQKYLFGS